MIDKVAVSSPPYENSQDTALDKLRLNAFVDEVRSGLERLTLENVKTVVLKFEELSIGTQDKLSVFVDLIFEKAVDEPSYSVAVAEICKLMQFKKVPVERGGGKEHEHVNFRKFLIGRCQKEYEKEHVETLNGKVFMLDIAAATTENDKNRIRNEFEKRDMQLRGRSMGVLRFICELYRLNMLIARRMHECIKKLLMTKDEESLERLCMLLTNIGKELEEETSRTLLRGPQPGINDLSVYFKEMSSLVEKSKISFRVRSLMQDVIELRMMGWKKIVKDQGPSASLPNNNAARKTYSRGIVKEESNGCKVEKVDEEMNNKMRGIAVQNKEDASRYLLTYNRRSAEVGKSFDSKLSNQIVQQVSENPVSTGPVKVVTVRAKLSSPSSSQDKFKSSTAESEPLREKLRKKLVNHIECKAVKK